jgi:chromosome segregation ATPase
VHKSHDDKLKAYEANDAALQATLTSNLKKLNDLSTSMTTNTNADSTLTLAVDKVKSEVATNTKDVADLKKSLGSTITADASAGTAGIAANKKAVSNLDSKVVALTQKVDDDKKLIDANAVKDTGL